MASNDTHGNKPVLNVIVLGDSGVGKSTMVDIFRTGPSWKSEATVGVNVLRKDVVVADEPCVLEIRDVAGEEVYRSVSSPYYRNCHACILMFAFEKYRSYRNLFRWHHDILEYASDAKRSQFPFVVVDNRWDMIEKQRIVNLGSASSVLMWCAVRGIPFYEIGCGDSGTIAKIFEVAQVKAYEFVRDQNASDAIAIEQDSAMLASAENKWERGIRKFCF